MDCKSLKRSSRWSKAFRTSPSSTPIIKDHRPKSSTASQTPSIASNTLEQKYGRPDKMLSNEGAGGAILRVTRKRDNTVFAVKLFTPRLSVEDDEIYTRKVFAEYAIGARLRHPNIIKTLDLFHEHGRFLQVMQYAPYCLFDRVMSRKMSTAEINCAFMQIMAAASHIHRCGFAHRDLKLENVVMTENGIMKLIDFGSAVICKEPGRRSAFGFVGSLSYMAPEVFARKDYDPQKSDVWSLAIVYCCMMLGRFPWRSPDRSNEAFALFAATEAPKTHLGPPSPPSRASSTSSVTVINVSISGDGDDNQKITENVLGPWGLLRQLPSESRDVIKAMLTINPDRRPTLQQVITMPWIANAQHCTEDDEGSLDAVAGHQHVG